MKIVLENARFFLRHGVLDIGHVSHDITNTYTIDGSVLTCCVKCRDLSIIIHVTRNLSISHHIHATTAKAHPRANSIHRCFCLVIIIRWFALLMCVPSSNTIHLCDHLV